MVIMSGAFGAIEGMPLPMQYFSVIDPARYMARMVRGIMINGAGLDVLWPDLAILALYSVVLYGASAHRFRRQLR